MKSSKLLLWSALFSSTVKSDKRPCKVGLLQACKWCARDSNTKAVVLGFALMPMRPNRLMEDIVYKRWLAQSKEQASAETRHALMWPHCRCLNARICIPNGGICWRSACNPVSYCPFHMYTCCFNGLIRPDSATSTARFCDNLTKSCKATRLAECCLHAHHWLSTSVFSLLLLSLKTTHGWACWSGRSPQPLKQTHESGTSLSRLHVEILGYSC